MGFLAYVALDDGHLDPEFADAPRSLSYTICSDGTPGNSCNLCKDPSTPGCDGVASRSCACVGEPFGDGGVEEAAMEVQFPKGCNINCQRTDDILKCMMNIGDRQSDKKPMAKGNADAFACTAQGASSLADQSFGAFSKMFNKKHAAQAQQQAGEAKHKDPFSWLFPAKKK